MGAIQATRHQPRERSRATQWGARPSPLMGEAARSMLPKRQGRTEHQTHRCEALGGADARRNHPDRAFALVVGQRSSKHAGASRFNHTGASGE